MSIMHANLARDLARAAERAKKQFFLGDHLLSFVAMSCNRLNP